MRVTLLGLMIILVLITTGQLTAGSTNHKEILTSNTITSQSSHAHNDNGNSVSTMAASGMDPGFKIRVLSEIELNGNTANSTINQDIDSTSTLLTQLVSSGSGQKEIIWDPANDWQRITYNCEVDLEFDVVYNTQRGDIFQYVIVELRGTVHFWGTAEHYFYGSRNTLNFDDTRNYTIENPPNGLLEYSASKQRVTYAQSSLGSGTGDIVPYFIQFFGLANPYSARLSVDLPANWYFDDVYENCNPGMGVDLTDSVILSPRAKVTYDDGKFQYNSAYPGNWRMVALGTYLQADFELDTVPGSAKLVIDHLSSASSDPSCTGGGYSPVDIIVNGQTVEQCYDPAENHGGSHSFVTDHWDIGAYLQSGNNTIRVQLCDTACSHYWIRYLYIEDLGDDCASCDLQTIRVSEISVRENVPIRDVPRIIWTKEQPDDFHPVTDTKLNTVTPNTELTMSESAQSEADKDTLTMWGTKYSIKIEKANGIEDYHTCKVKWEVFEIDGHVKLDRKTLELSNPITPFVIDVQERVGQYRLELTFSFFNEEGTIIGIPETKTHDFYVIHSNPVCSTVPPDLDWIKKATNFAEGANQDDASGVLRALMSSFRNQGWEYSQVESGLWSVANYMDLLFKGKKYGSCATFVDAWRFLASVLGINTGQHEENGIGIGFLMKLGFTTLDNLLGNAYNASQASPVYDRWFFAWHMLGKHTPKEKSLVEYYDPLFYIGPINDSQFSIEDYIVGNGPVFLGRPLSFETSTGYKIYARLLTSFNPFNRINKFEYEPPSSSAEALVNAHLFDPSYGSLATFTGGYSAYGVDTDSDGVFNSLAIDVEVDGTIGDYVVSGTLYKNSNIISVRSSKTSQVFASGSVTLSGSNPEIVTVLFSGEDILKSGLDGAYTADMFLLDPNSNVLDYHQFDTHSITHSLYGEKPARLIGLTDSGIDDDGNGLFDWLVAVIELDATQAMKYRAIAFLSDYPNAEPFMFERGQLDPPDSNSIEIMFDGRVISELGKEGPYIITVSLYDPNENYIAFEEYRTSAYTSDMFEPPPARFTGNCTDHVVFAESGCPLEMLVIDVEVEVNEASIYEIDGWLFASDGSVIEIVPIEPNLGIGTTTVSLEFDGKRIAEQGLDGPYYLTYVAMRQQNAENNGYLTAVQHIYETAPYLVCAFDANTSFFAGDIDCSCIVDFEDIAILANQWIQPPGVPSADIAPFPGDGIVSFQDFAVLAENWLK